MVLRIGINGFGRIARCITRSIFENNLEDEISLVQINAPSNIDGYAHLLKYDSVHGKFSAQVEVAEDNFVINDLKIRKTSSRNANETDWEDADIIFECTGEFNDKNLLTSQIKGNVKKILVSAPCKDADATIIYGVNHEKLEKQQKVISIGSCTTNCLAPLANILNKTVGIENGFVTTIHAYTNDQRVLDGSHKDLRRARACNLSMIPTSTGAAKAIGEVLPELAGKLDGTAIRVPVPNVSLIDFTFNSKRETSQQEINQIMQKANIDDKFGIIGFLEEPLVSIDINHSMFSIVFDPFETRVIGKNLVRVLSWYDNEWAYSQRMIDVARFIAKKSLL